MFFTKTHIELHDTYSVGCRGEGRTVLEMALRRRDVAHEIKSWRCKWMLRNAGAR